MGIKLFVTDLDGTLLNSEHHISEGNKRAIREAVARGVTVTIATGRMYASALPFARELGLDVPIMTYNGALIKSAKGEELCRVDLEEQDVLDVLGYCLERDWYVQLYSGDTLYYAEENEFSRFYEHAAGVRGKAVGRDGLYEHVKNVPKLLSISSGEEETDRRAKELGEAFAGRVCPMKSNDRYVEIVRVGVSKAASILRLAERLGIRREEIMAIGDSNNDLPMLQAAGIGVAMGNANAEVKAACSYVTADCDADGVALAIREHVLR